MELVPEHSFETDSVFHWLYCLEITIHLQKMNIVIGPSHTCEASVSRSVQFLRFLMEMRTLIIMSITDALVPRGSSWR